MRWCGFVMTMLAFGCAPSSRDDDVGPAPTAGAETTGHDDVTTGAPDGDIRYDVATMEPATTGGGGTCHVLDDGNAAPPCHDKAPPNSYDPVVEWSWAGVGGRNQGMLIPLVANLTDDNDDGAIDLCDTPDVAVVAYDEYTVWKGRLSVLDGATGSPHFEIEADLDALQTPAIGDIDNDGLPEIVAAIYGTSQLVAFEHDGTLKWTSTGFVAPTRGAIALADVDNDGDVEILSGPFLVDHEGHTLHQLAFKAGVDNFGHAVTAADLDDDDDLEIIIGQAAYDHDATEQWNTWLQGGFPQVANLDDDPAPEVLLVTLQGISIIEHDGQVTAENLRPTGVPSGANKWLRPAAIHDLDGDTEPEIALSSEAVFAVYEHDASLKWTSEVLDKTGSAAATAFDFLGHGTAQAMYADETILFTYDASGSTLLEIPRSSGTHIEYPVVADVDNDGSSEMLVVSNEGWFSNQTQPLLQVIGDVDDRWVQGRRIWNQHTYHVTNVREDGTIPQFEPPHWDHLNTFRTQAQIEDGGVCKPMPEG